MDEEVDLQDGHIQVYEHWRVHVTMQDALLPDQTSDGCGFVYSRARWCCIHGWLLFCLSGRAHSCNAGNELFKVCPAGQTCKVTTHKRSGADLSEHINLDITGDCWSTTSTM